MGSGQSKQAAVSTAANGVGTKNNNEQSRSHAYQAHERDESGDDDCQCSVFSFCGGRSRSGKGRGHRRRQRGSDLLGTPLPDTPLADRRRQRGQDHGYGEPRMPPEIYSSRYAGLEKEPSSMYVQQVPQVGAKGILGGGSPAAMDRQKPHSAQIFEGSDSEKELYAKYEIAEVLGAGSTSTCHRCVERKTMQSYACKIIDKRHIEQRFQGMIEQFRTEIEALRSLQHPNIITLYDVYISDEKIYIVMELMSGGELFDYVVNKGTLNEEEASKIVQKVTSALVYMHSKNIIHRDLKPENLMLIRKPRDGEDIEVKIIDFGLSKCMEEPVARSFLGTRGYLAPEMLQRREYTRSVDAWALGVIVFVLLCGCLPFDDDSAMIPTDAMVRTKFQLRFPRWARDLSASAKDLLSKLLDIEERRRYTAEQALEHPWVVGKTARKDSLLQSPGRIHQLTPGGRPQFGAPGSKAHQNHMQAKRAKGNSFYPNAKPVRQLVRKKSI